MRLRICLATWALTIACSGGESGPESPPTGTNREGQLAVRILGLPPNVAGSVTITSSGGIARWLNREDTLALPADTYTITAEQVATASEIYVAPDPPQTIKVTAGGLASVAVVYLLNSGSLQVDVDGLPDGVPAALTVVGPNFRARIDKDTLLRPVRAGSYIITAEPIEHASDRYGSEGHTIQVSVRPQPSVATVAFRVITARMVVSVAGLPNGAQPTLRAKNVYGEFIPVVPGQDVVLLNPAEEWEVQSDTVRVSGEVYVPLRMFQRPPLVASTQTTSVTVDYIIPGGQLVIRSTGIAGSASAPLRLLGPNRLDVSIATDSTLTRLTPGTYTIYGDRFQADGDDYDPAEQMISVNVPNGGLTQVSMAFKRLTRKLNVNITGLPNGLDAPVRLVGPQFPTGLTLTHSTLLGPLQSGEYTVFAPVIERQNEGYLAVRDAQLVSVFPADQPQEVDIEYINNGPMNLSIGSPRVMQSAYRKDGTLSLVADKEALITLSVACDRRNGAQPLIRVRLFHNGVLVHTMNAPPPTPTVPWPSGPSEFDVLGWFTARVPAMYVQPGLGVLIDVDPGNAYLESNESDNVYPRSQIPIAIPVERTVPVAITLIPIVQSANGATGSVSAATADAFVYDIRRMFPLGSLSIALREPFTINGPALMPDNVETWGQAASQLAALQAAEGGSSFYYGVVKTTYSAGIAGVGVVSGKAALGWDVVTSAREVMAHEIGHNFGLLHAPCGTSDGVDPNFPYPGTIGFGGFDLVTGRAIGSQTPDFMGYCSESWISDYSYRRILDRVTLGSAPRSSPRARSTPSLLLWGRVSNGHPILEPAFELEAVPTTQRAFGSHIIEATAEDGSTLFRFAFDGSKLGDTSSDDEVFAFVVPMTLLRGQRLAVIRLTSHSRTTESRWRESDGPQPPRAVRSSNASIRIASNGGRGLLVRNARTGQILALGRGAFLDVTSLARDLEVTVSDGVRSTAHRLRTLPR